jgi:ATP-dependent helicase YprA (DUF1998 family)
MHYIQILMVDHALTPTAVSYRTYRKACNVTLPTLRPQMRHIGGKVLRIDGCKIPYGCPHLDTLTQSVGSGTKKSH